MRFFEFVAGFAFIILTLVDGFETILQPRRVTHRFRFARLYYRNLWALWRSISLRLNAGKRREAFLGVFAPLSLLGLFMVWVVALIVGFALVQQALGSHLKIADEQVTFSTFLYLSGTTFFTLGYGDVTPTAPLGRALAVTEAGLGFGFLAVIISYLPVLQQAFSRREVTISLLDARAGSPPAASEVLARVARSGSLEALDPLLSQWEIWAAELLESHLSFPVLSYYRSQHDNQSWLAALTSILDTCAILIVDVTNHNSYQAQLTFAMARHAAVDLSLVLKAKPGLQPLDRLPQDQRQLLQDTLKEAGLDLRKGSEFDAKLTELRGMYEPFLGALSERFLFTLPPLIPPEESADNWQRSAWMRKTPGIGSLPMSQGENEHFE